MGLMSEAVTQFLIPASALVGIAFALLQWFLVSRVAVSTKASGYKGYHERLIQQDHEEGDEGDTLDNIIKCAEIQNTISVGATSFLFPEYKYLSVFMGTFGLVIFLFLGSVEGFSTLDFLLSALTSTLSGFPGMKIATYANARMTFEARKGVGKAFIAAFRSVAVMGFLLAANGLLVLYASINLFKLYYGDDWEGLYEYITGYGLGGSSMALFGRVRGGINTKAADVGAELVVKVEKNIPEDDPRNLAVIADNVGDNVGDIAGMGSDLFGYYAESSCAALFVASISSFGTISKHPDQAHGGGIAPFFVTSLNSEHDVPIRLGKVDKEELLFICVPLLRCTRKWMT